MFEHIKAQANERRDLESKIFADYNNGTSVKELGSKYHVTNSYIKAVVEIAEREK